MADKDLYHPDRYRRSRLFWKQMYDLFSKHSDKNHTMEKLEILLDAFRPIYNRELSKIHVDQRPLNSTEIFSQEMSYFNYFARFLECGRNIFSFPPVFSDLFRQTEVDDVVLESLRFPYPCFYISFGIQADMDLWNSGYFVDGAYIDSSLLDLGNLSIVLSTRQKDLDYGNLNFIYERDRYFFFPFKIESLSETVGEAIENAKKEHEPFKPSKVPDTSGVYNVEGRDVAVFDRGKETQERVAKENIEGFPVYLNAIRLIINGLCYLSSETPEIEYKYPDEVPKNFIEIMDRPARKADKKRVKKALYSMGIYSKIHFCGESLRLKYQGLPTGLEVSSHWRRGHWRNQAHGENLSQRKLIWIKPTLVRKDKGEPEKGHIYKIETRD